MMGNLVVMNFFFLHFLFRYKIQEIKRNEKQDVTKVAGQASEANQQYLFHGFTNCSTHNTLTVYKQ